MEKKNNEIFSTLEKLGLTSLATRSLFSTKARDNKDIRIWKDDISGVIYIDDFYIGEKTYRYGDYRNEEAEILERINDKNRRYKNFYQFAVGKKVLDFGCGAGDFLRLIKDDATEVFGIELQESYLKSLNKDGIKAAVSLDKVPDSYFDLCVSFHVLEHLPNPVDMLLKIKKKMKKNSKLIFEVPHANDFLLSSLNSKSFKDFTLLSQHLVLHTRDSLTKLFEYVGFKNLKIKGHQRYPLSNHLNWLTHKTSGGHKQSFSLIDSPDLEKAYQASLANIDATDTLIAIVET